jgi:hypothetical protein
MREKVLDLTAEKDRILKSKSHVLQVLNFLDKFNSGKS